MEIIPRLPDDVARQCLVRVDYNQFSTVVSTCKAWKSELQSPEFWWYRKQIGNSQNLIVMAQARVEPNSGSTVVKYRASPVYGFTLLEPETGVWSDLPPIPEFSNGLPMFCQVVSFRSGLVVLGGLDSNTWEVSKSVFVYDFLSATWRRGADMPGVRRSFFGCASDCDWMVYVVGGHDDEKNALKSAMVYDVDKDEWAPLPHMARERDECKAVFHHGKLHVIGGYCTDMQGRFERSAEVFDVSTWQWDQPQENFLEAAICPRTCVCGDDGEFYMCHGDDVLARKGSTWQAIAKLPSEVCNVAYVATWKSQIMVIGSAKFGDPHMAYVWESKNHRWVRVETPKEFSGHAQSGCYLQI